MCIREQLKVVITALLSIIREMLIEVGAGLENAGRISEITDFNKIFNYVEGNWL